MNESSDRLYELVIWLIYTSDLFKDTESFRNKTPLHCVAQDFNSSVVDLFGSIFVGGAI